MLKPHFGSADNACSDDGCFSAEVLSVMCYCCNICVVSEVNGRLLVGQLCGNG